MSRNLLRQIFVPTATLTIWMLSFNAGADAKYDALKAQVELLTKQLAQVQAALEESREQAVSKQEVAELKQEVKAVAHPKTPNTLVHMAGYADVGFTDSDNTDGTFNVGAFAPIFHYQYRDIVMLEAELDMEVAPDGSTDIGLEYLTADLFLNDYVTLVAGKFLSPIGQFRQNIHPSWINKLPSAPPGFGHDGAAPASDLGMQLRGGFPLGSMRANYAAFVSNGPELVAEWDGAEFELDGIDAEAKGRNVDGNKLVGGRFGLIPFAGLEVGASFASGKARVTATEGAGAPALAGEDNRDYDVAGFDYAWQYKAFELRGEYVKSKVGSASAGVSASQGAAWKSWYTQAAYRFPGSKLEGVLRYTDFDSPHASKDQKQWAFGMNYLFVNNVIGKISFESNRGQNGSLADDNRTLIQLAYGF